MGLLCFRWTSFICMWLLTFKYKHLQKCVAFIVILSAFRLDCLKQTSLMLIIIRCCRLVTSSVLLFWPGSVSHVKGDFNHKVTSQLNKCYISVTPLPQKIFHENLHQHFFFFFSYQVNVTDFKHLFSINIEWVASWKIRTVTSGPQIYLWLCLC